MKKITAILAFAMVSSSAFANPAYLNFLIQTQNDDANTTHKMDDLEATGNGWALAGVTTSSVFRLWTINRTTGAEFLLDEKTVSAYHPKAEITITSQDPYTLIPRTRVDQPFTLTYTVEGLRPSDPDAPAAAKSVVLDHTSTLYGPGMEHKDSTATSSKSQTLKAQNKTTTEVRMTSITAADLTTAKGEEDFTVWAIPDGVVTDYTILDQKKVQVWPIAQATVTTLGSTSSNPYETRIHLNLIDLYPSSTTYVRIRPGTITSPTGQYTKINASNVVINDTTPQDRDYDILNLNAFMPEGGIYTVEVIHETPFGSDILATHEIKKQTVIKINGHFTDSE